MIRNVRILLTIMLTMIQNLISCEWWIMIKSHRLIFDELSENVFKIPYL